MIVSIFVAEKMFRFDCMKNIYVLFFALQTTCTVFNNLIFHYGGWCF